MKERPVKDKSDLHKLRWGGQNENGNYLLTAEVTTSSIPSLYDVTAIVKTKDGSPIEKPIALLFHDTFNPMVYILDAGNSAEVRLTRVAYEAFTIAALAEVDSEKPLELELDINEMPNLPKGFYW